MSLTTFFAPLVERQEQLEQEMRQFEVDKMHRVLDKIVGEMLGAGAEIPRDQEVGILESLRGCTIQQLGSYVFRCELKEPTESVDGGRLQHLMEVRIQEGITDDSLMRIVELSKKTVQSDGTLLEGEPIAFVMLDADWFVDIEDYDGLPPGAVPENDTSIHTIAKYAECIEAAFDNRI